jgi:hypothetical protein
MAKPMDQDVKQLTKDIVKELTDKDYQFTAYDVTKLVRGTTNDCIPHWQVKGVVHDMFDNGEMVGNYSRRFIIIPGTNDRGLLYHNTGSNQGVYDPDLVPSIDIDGTKNSSTVTALVQDDEDDDDCDDDDEDTISTVSNIGTGYIARDGRGRLCIPVSLVRELNLNPGNTAVVYPTIECLCIYNIVRPVDFVPKSTDRNFRVDRNGNIRLTASVLKEAYIVHKNTLRCFVKRSHLFGGYDKKIVVSGY